MSVLIQEVDLPQELTAEAAVEAAYAAELAETASKLQRGLPRSSSATRTSHRFCTSTCGTGCAWWACAASTPRRPAAPGGAAAGRHAGRHDRHDDRPAARGRARGRRTPRRRPAAPRSADHQPGGLTAEAREGHPLLYENPELVWLGFKDPSFPLPKVIENLFPAPHQPARHRPQPAASLGHAQGSRKFGASSTRGRCTGTFGRQRRAAASAAVHAGGRGLPRRPRPGLPPAPPGPRSAARWKCRPSASTRTLADTPR